MSFLRGAFITCPHQIANHFILISDLQVWYHLQISVYFPFHHQKYWTVLDSEHTSASQFPKKSFVTTLNVDFQPYKPTLQHFHLVHTSWERYKKAMCISGKSPAKSIVISGQSFSQTPSALGFAYHIS